MFFAHLYIYVYVRYIWPNGWTKLAAIFLENQWGYPRVTQAKNIVFQVFTYDIITKFVCYKDN